MNVNYVLGLDNNIAGRVLKKGETSSIPNLLVIFSDNSPATLLPQPGRTQPWTVLKVSPKWSWPVHWSRGANDTSFYAPTSNKWQYFHSSLAIEPHPNLWLHIIRHVHILVKYSIQSAPNIVMCACWLLVDDHGAASSQWSGQLPRTISQGQVYMRGQNFIRVSEFYRNSRLRDRVPNGPILIT